MSLLACSGVIPNCRVSILSRVVSAAVPGGRREGRQALPAGRERVSPVRSSAIARQPNPRLPVRGPRPDATIAATCAARHVRVGVRALQAPYRLSAHAHDTVAVAYRVASGLDPNGGVGYLGTVGMPRFLLSPRRSRWGRGRSGQTIVDVGDGWSRS